MKKNILDWIIISSADPSKTSMTLKGILLQYTTLIMLALGLMHVPLTNTQVYDFITDATGFIGIALSGFGLLRKMYFLIKGIVNKTEK